MKKRREKTSEGFRECSIKKGMFLFLCFRWEILILKMCFQTGMAH